MAVDVRLCAYFLLQLALMRTGCVAQYTKLPSIQIVNKSDSSQARKLMQHSEWCVVPDVFPRESLGVSQYLSQELSPTWRLPMAFATHRGSSWAVWESPVLHHHFCSHRSPFNGSSFPSERLHTAPKSQAQYQQLSSVSSWKAVSPPPNPHLKTTDRWVWVPRSSQLSHELSIAAGTPEPSSHSHFSNSILLTHLPREKAPHCILQPLLLTLLTLPGPDWCIGVAT